MVACHLGRVR